MKQLNLCVFAGVLLLFAGCTKQNGGAGETASNESASGSVDYPTKTVQVICPWSAGGGTDRVTRYFADQLQQTFGKPFVVVNKTGGGGAVGHSAGAFAKPDGYTLSMITFELNTMHWLGITELTYENYDLLMQVNGDAAAIMVRADAPWKTINEFVEAIRSGSKKLTMSGTATGGAWDLARAGFLKAAGLEVSSVTWLHKAGSAPSITALLGGHIDAVCCSVPEAANNIGDGPKQLRVLAVMSDERLPEYPDIPTVKESGIDWSAVGWRGLALPKGTPPEIIAKLHEACQKIAESEEYKAFMKKNGFNIILKGPEAFTAFLKEQDAQWKSVLDAAGYIKK